jgi:acetone carboxylase gamma subunit
MAYRQRLCTACFCTNVLGLDREIEAAGALTCPACGANTEHDMEAVYATAYIPGVGRHRLELPLCPSCATEVRVRAQTNAELLPERPPESRGLAPSSAPRDDAWSRLGIVPRD